METIAHLHQEILACRRCQDAGYLQRAAPVVGEAILSPMMLIGQAPGQVEQTIRRPFAGRAGRELFRWMLSIGITEEEFRARVYISAVTRCFPGKARSGSGDRRPSSAEVALCRPWLERQLVLIRPRTIIPVGGLAIERSFPRRPLAELIGQRLEVDGVAYIPLPHPSGASRWLNQPSNRKLLETALGLIRAEWQRHFAEAPIA